MHVQSHFNKALGCWDTKANYSEVMFLYFI